MLNIKKGAAAVAATVAMLGGTILPVAAEEKTTTINYTVDQSYAWTVPAKVTFTKNGDTTQTGKVDVSQNVIGYGKTLAITVGGTEDFTLKDSADAANTRKYQVFVNGATTAIAKGGSVLNVAAGTNTGSASLKFALDKITVEKSGSYTDTLAFAAAIK